MTQTETARRLTAAEDEIRVLRAELSALRRASAETRMMVKLAAMQTPESAEILDALAAPASDFGEPRTEPPRPRLRMVHSEGQAPEPARALPPRLRAVDSVGGRDMDEALRRVRGGEGR